MRIGAASGSIFWICGGLVSRGNWPTMVATLSRTSCVADSMSRSSMNVMVTRDAALVGVGAQLVDAADGVDGLFDPLGDLGLDFLGAGAGQLDLTLTTGESVFGIRSRPSSRYENAPRTMSAAVIMIGEDRPLDADVDEDHWRCSSAPPAVARRPARLGRAGASPPADP